MRKMERVAAWILMTGGGSAVNVFQVSVVIVSEVLAVEAIKVAIAGQATSALHCGSPA